MGDQEPRPIVTRGRDILVAALPSVFVRCPVPKRATLSSDMSPQTAAYLQARNALFDAFQENAKLDTVNRETEQAMFLQVAQFVAYRQSGQAADAGTWVWQEKPVARDKTRPTEDAQLMLLYTACRGINKGNKLRAALSSKDAASINGIWLGLALASQALDTLESFNRDTTKPYLTNEHIAYLKAVCGIDMLACKASFVLCMTPDAETQRGRKACEKALGWLLNAGIVAKKAAKAVRAGLCAKYSMSQWEASSVTPLEMFSIHATALWIADAATALHEGDRWLDYKTAGMAVHAALARIQALRQRAEAALKASPVELVAGVWRRRNYMEPAHVNASVFDKLDAFLGPATRASQSHMRENGLSCSPIESDKVESAWIANKRLLELAEIEDSDEKARTAGSSFKQQAVDFREALLKTASPPEAQVVFSDQPSAADKSGPPAPASVATQGTNHTSIYDDDDDDDLIYSMTF